MTEKNIKSLNNTENFSACLEPAGEDIVRACQRDCAEGHSIGGCNELRRALTGLIEKK